jgi:anti-sigma factor RsiW
MTNHSRMERQLSAYLDNELTTEDAQQVRMHLESCTLCRDELHRLEQVKRLLGALPERAPAPQVWEELRQKLEAHGPRETEGVLEVIRNAFRRPALALAAAAFVILLIALPLVKGRIDRLRAAEVGPDVFVREHALSAAADPFADRAYLGLLVSDANLTLVGEPRNRGENLR